MAVAALYDIHGNLPALDAVLAEVKSLRVDEIIVGGDIAPGPQPREVFDRLLNLPFPVAFIRGNCENAILAAASGDPDQIRQWVPPQALDPIRWSTERLSGEPLREIERWPPMLRRAIPGIGQVLFCHATPRSANEIFTRLTDEAKLRPIFDGVGVDVVVCGHTHMQFDRKVGTTRVVNAGSVGMPFGLQGAEGRDAKAPDPQRRRNQAGVVAQPRPASRSNRGAYWLLLGPRIELRRTGVDSAEVAAAVSTSDCPQPQTFLTLPEEDEILRAYSRAELS